LAAGAGKETEAEASVAVSGYVLGQTAVGFHNVQDGSVYVCSSDVSSREDAVEVAVNGLRERCAVFRLDTHGNGHGIHGFAFAVGSVNDELIHYAFHADQRSAAVSQGAVNGAAVGTSSHAEGGIAGGAVGDGSREVRDHATLALEDHVTPAAIRAARCFGHGHGGSAEQQCANQYFFHFPCSPW